MKIDTSAFKQRVTYTIVCLVTSLLISFSESVVALDQVTLQLRWHNQFQFAGYYAAIEQGYYRDAGLEVTVVEGQPNKKPVIEVLKGNAEYGVGNSEVLLSRLTGSPLVALAAVYQHSPSILLAKKSSGIHTPHDLIGRSVMLMNQNIDADFVAMFHNEGIDIADINITPSSYNIEDLVNDKTEVFNSYSTNEPFYLKQLGIEYTVLNPKSYGVDFYSDILFTTEAELAEHPARAKAFRQASLKGWQYAFDHPEEIIDLLIEKYDANKTRAHLLFEAEEIEKLVLPDVIEIGHMNPWRWQHMAETFVDAGMVSDTDKLTGFDYEQLTAIKQQKWSDIGKLTTAFSLFAIASLVMLILAYKKTKREVQLRIEAEHALKQLAYTDELTGLHNRHQFYILTKQAMKNAVRNKTPLVLCFVDIDNFKYINDNHGHHVGDVVLKHMAQVLKSSTRHSDVVARIGGDEFVIVFTNMTTSKARELLNKISSDIAKTLHFDAVKLIISASIGLSAFNGENEDVDDLLRAADRDMYMQKHRAR